MSVAPPYSTSENDPFGTWLFSLGCMIILPSLPLLVEAARNIGVVRPDSLYLTAAVLAASYGIASLGNLFRFCYLCTFLAALALDDQPQTGPKLVGGIASTVIFFLVAGIQAIERFRWHVNLNFKFPDWLEGR